MTGFQNAARRAVATFVFATCGVLVTVPLLDQSADVWKLAVGTGIGSLINLAYRWAEAEVRKGGV